MSRRGRHGRHQHPGPGHRIRAADGRPPRPGPAPSGQGASESQPRRAAPPEAARPGDGPPGAGAGAAPRPDELPEPHREPPLREGPGAAPVSALAGPSDVPAPGDRRDEVGPAPGSGLQPGGLSGAPRDRGAADERFHLRPGSLPATIPGGAPAAVAAAPAVAPGPDALRPSCTVAQLRRFIKSRPWIPLHELRRRFGIVGADDDVTPIRVGDHTLFIGLPPAEGRLVAELLAGGDVGFELSLDPGAPVVVGVYPMRPVPRG